jgi:hypothetical protein
MGPSWCRTRATSTKRSTLRVRPNRRKDLRWVLLFSAQFLGFFCIFFRTGRGSVQSRRTRGARFRSFSHSVIGRRSCRRSRLRRIHLGKSLRLHPGVVQCPASFRTVGRDGVSFPATVFVVNGLPRLRDYKAFPPSGTFPCRVLGNAACRAPRDGAGKSRGRGIRIEPWLGPC